MKDHFIAETLSSNQLLCLLFLAEQKRKKGIVNRENLEKETWEDIKATFSKRFENLGEEMRFEVLGAHLMSVEDLDIYDNAILETVLRDNDEMMSNLLIELKQDPRFQIGNA